MQPAVTFCATPRDQFNLPILVVDGPIDQQELPVHDRSVIGVETGAVLHGLADLRP